MRARRPKDDDRVPASPLAVRLVEGNLAFTPDAAWAWYVVPTQRWAFRADGQRLNLVVDAASRLAALAGHRAHLRVTPRPYPVAAWAWCWGHPNRAPVPARSPSRRRSLRRCAATSTATSRRSRAH